MLGPVKILPCLLQLQAEASLNGFPLLLREPCFRTHDGREACFRSATKSSRVRCGIRLSCGRAALGTMQACTQIRRGARGPGDGRAKFTPHGEGNAMKQVHGGRLIMRCPTRARLERRMKYVTATLDYARKNLLAKAATCSEAEWLVLLDYVDRAGDL